MTKPEIILHIGSGMLGGLSAILAKDYRLLKGNFHHELTVALVASIINGAIASGLILFLFKFSASTEFSVHVISGLLSLTLISSLLKMVNNDVIRILIAIAVFFIVGAMVNGLIFGLLNVPATGWFGTFLHAFVLSGIGFFALNAVYQP